MSFIFLFLKTYFFINFYIFIFTLIINKMDAFGCHHQLSFLLIQSMNLPIIHSAIYSLIKDQHILSQAWTINKFLYKETNTLC
jgi:hypothetical protein